MQNDMGGTRARTLLRTLDSCGKNSWRTTQAQTTTQEHAIHGKNGLLERKTILKNTKFLNRLG
jgi:hypothetical protein